MCDCVSSAFLPCSGSRIGKLGFTWRNRKFISVRRRDVVSPDLRYLENPSFRNRERLLISGSFKSEGAELNSANSTRAGKNSRELGFMEREREQIELGTGGRDQEIGNLKRESGIGIGDGTRVDGRIGDASASPSSSLYFLEFNEKSGTDSETSLKDDNFAKTESADAANSKLEEKEGRDGSWRRCGRQLTRKSNMVAKQVISVHSALCLGFVSELWVDTNSWAVLVVEVRPHLLSGESERFLLEDVCQVGDVVLIQNETVMENEFKMVGLETLVGYNVVTPGRQNIGKVRGYSFNINSGSVESLELDSFGISIIPSSLVSTYALFVEDVLEVVSDTVVVHESAVSRIQRLTKGFWDAGIVWNSKDNLGEYSDHEGTPARSGCGRRRQRNSSSRKLRRMMRETIDAIDDWELPIDYL